MTPEKNKRQVQDEIESARQLFLKTGRRMQRLKAEAGFRMTHIPYTGAGPAIGALLGGQVDAAASGPSTVAQHIKAGKLRALAHWGDRPLASLPDVHTCLREGITLEHLRELATALTDVQAAEELNEARAALFKRVPARTG
jgi:tripartite-type tricarboxylate transporter receptor subunit TctC